MNTSASRRLWLQGGGALLLSFGVQHAAHGAGIVAVRVWPARDYTRVTIESDRALVARSGLTEAPYRLTVDIDNLELDASLRQLVGQVRPDDPFILGVRVGQYQPRVVRLVFDLKQLVRPEQFALFPVPPYQHRLILDIYPQAEVDPLLALVRDREAAAQRAQRDALGEWISGGHTTAPAAPASTAAGVAPAPQAPEAQSGEAAPSRASTSAAAAASAAPAAPPATPVATPPSTPPVALSNAERQRIDRLMIVAVDPGHGGEDPGAIGPTGLREKDVVLSIALELRDRLNAVSGMRVMLTRDADFFVPLHERVRKARRVQADLFVSLHADAFMRPQARGASVFALSTKGASSAAARWMAERENAADRVGGVNVGRVSDPQILQALLDMSTTAQINHSLKVGAEVLGRIGKVGRLHKGQVEQAGFAVLKAPDIPSILVETAFISNPEEEDQLRDAAYRTQLVGALASGIRRWFLRNPSMLRQRQV